MLACLLLLPASIQLVHAFEQHHHNICTSDVEQHFHEDEFECVLCHLQAETDLIFFPNRHEVIPTSFYHTFNDNKPVRLVSVSLSKKSSRAPPYFTV